VNRRWNQNPADAAGPAGPADAAGPAGPADAAGPAGPAGPPARLEPDEVPGLIRLTLTTAWRTLTWTAGSALATGTRAFTRTLNGDPPVLIVRDIVEEVRGTLIGALGGYDPTSGFVSGQRPYQPGYRAYQPASGAPTLAELREFGAALLARSADVNAAGEDEGHPAYARILSELTPDEARILRLLYRAGPQPTLNVRTYRPLGIGSELIAEDLNMIGENAGLRRMDRIQSYLTNLNRQGLIDFSRESVDDPGRYQLIEAQPDVAVARARAGHVPRIVYRSIRLTTFGHDFCHDCLLAAEPNGQAASPNGQTPNGQAPNGQPPS
jgi:Abortive infection alpha